MSTFGKYFAFMLLFGCLFALGCSAPNADPQNASGESETLDEEAYAKEMAEEAARVSKELGSK